ATAVDNQLPPSTTPAHISTNASTGECNITGLELGAPITSDNCGVASLTNDAPASFPIGSTVVHWTATDVHGNTNSCQQTVTVVDTQPPTITCPADVTTNADVGQCYVSAVALGTPIVADDCSP